MNPIQQLLGLLSQAAQTQGEVAQGVANPLLDLIKGRVGNVAQGERQALSEFKQTGQTSPQTGFSPFMGGVQALGGAGATAAAQRVSEPMAKFISPESPGMETLNAFNESMLTKNFEDAMKVTNAAIGAPQGSSIKSFLPKMFEMLERLGTNLPVEAITGI